MDVVCCPLHAWELHVTCTHAYCGLNTCRFVQSGYYLNQLISEGRIITCVVYTVHTLGVCTVYMSSASTCTCTCTF